MSTLYGTAQDRMTDQPKSSHSARNRVHRGRHPRSRHRTEPVFARGTANYLQIRARLINRGLGLRAESFYARHRRTRF